MTKTAFWQCPNRNLVCDGDRGGKRCSAHFQPVIHVIDNWFFQVFGVRNINDMQKRLVFYQPIFSL